jgi:hypothetical protein
MTKWPVETALRGKAGFSPYTSQTELHKMSTTNLYLGRSRFRPVATKIDTGSSQEKTENHDQNE